MRRSERLFTVLGVVAMTCLLDQATKRIATQRLKDLPPIHYLGDLFRFQYIENPGAFLGLGTGLGDTARNGLLTVGVGLVLLALLVHIFWAKQLSRLTLAAYALIIAGGGSNWADRLLHHGRVVDFMNVGIGPVRSGIFNVADLAIDASFVLLLIQWSIERRGSKTSSVAP